MTIKNMDDIERENAERERRKFNDNVTQDIENIFGNLFKEFKKEKKEKKKPSKIFNIIKYGLGLLLVLVTTTFFLGNIWLIKYFLENIF